MKIRLWRIFHLQHPFYCILISIALVLITVTEFTNDVPFQEILLTLGILLLFSLFVLPFSFPKYLEIQNGILSYTDWFQRRFDSNLPLRITYTVEAFTEITLLQTPFERLFNVGHLKVTGLSGFVAQKNQYIEMVRERRVHRIYGIPHFKEFRKEIHNHITLRKD